MLELETSEGTLQLEHSLLSVSKWESIYEKPFLTKTKKSDEEMLDYFQCMILSKGHGVETLYGLSAENLYEIEKYLGRSQSASAPPRPSGGRNNEVITSEVLYYQLAELKIPFSVESWPLNRMMNLIAITASKKQPPKKTAPRETLNEWEAQNKRAREMLNSNG